MALNRPVQPIGPNIQPPKPPAPKAPAEEEPIALVETEDASSAGLPSPGESGVAMSIRPPGAAAGSGVRAIKSSLELDKRIDFKRKAVNTGSGAVRCRMFHSKIAESSMEHMQDQINTWLDDENIDVKHVGHMVGALEGKHTEPNIIVMVWY